MSRLKRAVHSIASSYAVLVANAVYSLISWPLAMHYLSDSRFGLWGLMSSIAGYLALIDLGMSGSVGRLLIDHKDDPKRGTYGSLIKTGWLVLATQAALIALIGYVLAPFLSRVLHIQTDLRLEFIALMRWQTAALALSFLTRIFGQILNAHQRIDIISYGQVLALGLNLLLLWWFFRHGYGVFSLVWAGLGSFCFATLWLVTSCWSLRLLPPSGAWGRPSWAYFQELFAYGKDLFMASVGAQMIIASQSMIITSRIGLVAAGAWYAGTRAFNLVSQAIWRTSDVSAPAFSEMMVRGERNLLRDRYRGMAILTASFSGFAAVSYALCNNLFVNVIGEWTKHPIAWSPLNDILLGMWMITNAVQRCYTMFIIQTKKLEFMRYIFFIEGTIYVLAALWVAPRFGLPGIIACSVICSTLFTGAYGAWRVSRYFAVPLVDVVLKWPAAMARMLAVSVPAAALLWWLTSALREPVLRLAVHAAFSLTVGLYLFLRLGVSATFQKEILQRAPRTFSPILRRVLVGAGQ